MNKPQIRIKGFDADLTKHIVGDFGTWSKGKLLSKSDIIDRGNTKCIHYGELFVLYGETIYDVVSKTNKFNNCVLSKSGNILFPDSDVTPTGLARCSAIMEDDVILGGGINILTLNDDLYAPYISYAINNEKKQIIQKVTGTTVRHINSKSLSEVEVTITTDLAEQHSIASFFRSLDSLINSTSKKLTSLKQIKAASLQAMFPQNGETKPKVRFKGFEEEWEKNKIGEIASFSKGHGYSKNDLCDKGCPIIMYGRMYTKYSFFMDEVDTFVVPKAQSVYSQGNEVILPASGETAEDIACAAAITSKGTILGGDLNILSFDICKFSTQFVALYITYGQTHFELAKYAQGKTVVHLHNSDIANGTIMLPSFEEQQKIASYFRSLDNQISLQEKRLEKLKQIKSACLDKMFV